MESITDVQMRLPIRVLASTINRSMDSASDQISFVLPAECDRVMLVMFDNTVMSFYSDDEVPISGTWVMAGVSYDMFVKAVDSFSNVSDWMYIDFYDNGISVSCHEHGEWSITRFIPCTVAWEDRLQRSDIELECV